jgi:hypothetical protein
MSIIKTPTLTVCSYGYLVNMLRIFDEAIANDPTLSTEENRCLRKLFDEVLVRSFLYICVYNSKKMLEKCKEQRKK